ncbi:hypothetical protein HQN87_21930 [Paenibacillus tritici]|uniref:Alpha-L-rhamnosidase C-terminal domain-containing protein n=1 Tax=Paenibacillus tritici TaxID=1873425 RepID=A0ABX2DV62_9BACL|nr:hypothetical protein [Paenibacillus tritici]
MYFKPDFICGLDSASGSYESVHGTIRVNWRQDLLNLETGIPQVQLPELILRLAMACIRDKKFCPYNEYFYSADLNAAKE